MDDKTPTTRGVRELLQDDTGATTLEYALILAAIGIPSYFIIMGALELLVAHYQMHVTLTALPLP